MLLWIHKCYSSVDQLKEIQPDYEFETKIIRTSGDDGNINVVGAFTSALQRAILAGEIDIAVHSFKDVPTEEVNGLRIIPIAEREDYRAVFSGIAAELDGSID